MFRFDALYVWVFSCSSAYRTSRTQQLISLYRNGATLWRGVAWRGVVSCGVVWCGVVWCGVVRCGVRQATLSVDITGDALAFPDRSQTELGPRYPQRIFAGEYTLQIAQSALDPRALSSTLVI